MGLLERGHCSQSNGWIVLQKCLILTKELYDRTIVLIIIVRKEKCQRTFLCALDLINCETLASCLFDLTMM